MKLMFGDLPIRPEDIQDLSRMVEERKFSRGKGSVQNIDVEENYIQAIKALVKPGNKKVVVDAGNGCTSLIAPKLFSELGYDVVELYCSFDGTFPNRNPNPAVYSNLEDVRKAVVENGADFGVAFDGDGDRAVFINEKGQVVNSESTLCILIKYYLKDKKSSVVYDQKSSSVVKKVTESLGSKAIMERSGHAFIKKTFLQNHSALAGEISGHFFFAELGHDDGLYAALKIGEILSQSKNTFSEMLVDIPTTIITPDIRIKWKYEEQDSLLKNVSKLSKRYTMMTLDGVRIEFPFGWLLVRKSVTEEVVTVRMEAEDSESLKKIVAEMLSVAPELEGKLPPII